MDLGGPLRHGHPLGAREAQDVPEDVSNRLEACGFANLDADA